MRHILCLGFACVVACGRATETTTSDRVSQQSAERQGTIAHFDLQTPADEPFVVHSKDVQVQRDRNSVIVKFSGLQVSRSPSENADINLDSLSVRVMTRERKDMGRSEDAELGQHLASGSPKVTLPAIELTVGDTAAECEKGCLLFISLDYSIQRSSRAVLGGAGKVTTSTSSAVARFVEVNLASGTASLVKTEPENTAAAAASSSNDCAYSASQASDALGRPMTLNSPVGDDCLLVPESLSGSMPFRLAVMKDVQYYDGLRSSPDAQKVSLGDGAVWLPGVTTLCAQKGDWTVSVKMGELGTVASPVDVARQDAEAIVRKILLRL